jgi:hypothetical protein
MVIDTAIEDRRQACARHVFEAQKTFLPFNVNAHCWVIPAILKAMQEAEQAFADVDRWRSGNCFSHFPQLADLGPTTL